MADTEDKSGASERSNTDSPLVDDVDEKSASGGKPDSNLLSGTGDTRPRQVRGEYHVRTVTWLQFNTSDIRSIGVAQAATTIFAALGTFAMSWYFDITKEIAINSGEADQYLGTVANVAFAMWIVFWVISLLAFIWQGLELSRIKEESGIETRRTKIKAWLKERGNR